MKNGIDFNRIDPIQSTQLRSCRKSVIEFYRELASIIPKCEIVMISAKEPKADNGPVQFSDSLGVR